MLQGEKRRYALERPRGAEGMAEIAFIGHDRNEVGSIAKDTADGLAFTGVVPMSGSAVGVDVSYFLR